MGCRTLPTQRPRDGRTSLPPVDLPARRGHERAVSSSSAVGAEALCSMTWWKNRSGRSERVAAFRPGSVGRPRRGPGAAQSLPSSTTVRRRRSASTALGRPDRGLAEDQVGSCWRGGRGVRRLGRADKVRPSRGVTHRSLRGWYPGHIGRDVTTLGGQALAEIADGRRQPVVLSEEPTLESRCF